MSLDPGARIAELLTRAEELNLQNESLGNALVDLQDRVEALEAALHIIAPRLEERRTTRDKRLAIIARAALAGREEQDGG